MYVDLIDDGDFSFSLKQSVFVIEKFSEASDSATANKGMYIFLSAQLRKLLS